MAGRYPIALPEAEIRVGWLPAQGQFEQHPAGLLEGIRPEWDQARAKLQQFASSQPAIVSTSETARLERLGRGLRRLLCSWGLGR